MAESFVEDDARGHRGIERCELPSKRNGREKITPFFYKPGDPFALAADYDCCRACEVYSRVSALPCHVQPYDPYIGLLDLVNGPAEVGDPGNCHVLQCTSRGPYRAGGHSNGAVFGYDHTVRAGCVDAAGDGSEVLRVLNAIEHDYERGRTARLRAFDEPVKRGVLRISYKCDDSLVVFCRGAAVEFGAVHRLNGDACSMRASSDLFDLRARFDPICDKDQVGLPASAQRLEDCTAAFDSRGFAGAGKA